MVEKVSTFWSFCMASATMEKAMNHSAARRVNGEPLEAKLAAIAVSAISAKSTTTGR